ncbi:MAG: outer membrane beta-barrel protein [Bacteroidaceae bacterium]|nr:outer membrane beta-barrel protein [Bacteroidaceae bacterium]
MKKVKFLISAVMLLVATTASAQSEDGYSAVYIQYNPQVKAMNNENVDDYHGIALGYKRGMSISQSHPLFLEAGLAFQYTIYDTQEKTKKLDFDEGRMGTLSIPVNITYRFTFGHTKFTVAPYMGLTLKGNLWAKDKYDERTSYRGKLTYIHHNRNLFDSDDMGGSDFTASRLQAAWQAGVNICLNKIYLGIGYGTDLVDFLKEERFNTTYMTLGVQF